MDRRAMAGLILDKVAVVHFGLGEVASAVAAAGAPLLHGEFLPPAQGDLRLVSALNRLMSPPLGPEIDKANQVALERVLASRPLLVGVATAREAVPGMDEDLFLHAGPPIEWDRMCGPLRGAIIGGLIYEGRARDPEEAARIAASGAIRFEPCHHHQAVGPMAGVVTPSMPGWVLTDKASSRRVFCTLNEGLGKVLRYGAYSPDVLNRLRWMAEELAPALSAALAVKGPIDLRAIMAQAILMGDEGHNRNRAATSLLFRELASPLVKAVRDPEKVARVFDFLNQNDHTFLNLSMPMAKCMLMAAEGTERSTMVLVMARNGTDFGIQVAGLPGRWFVGPAQAVEGVYFPGFGPADANPDIGDSAITETVGLGGFAMAAAPAIVRFVGGTAQDALARTEEMGRITIGRNPDFAIPALGFQGVPTGIDIRKVEELNLLPVINTGIAHKEPGVGQVGAGLTHPPWECFHGALIACEEAFGSSNATEVTCCR